VRRLAPHRRGLVVLAGRLANRDADAEDALQGALAAAWQRFRVGVDVADFRAWIARFLVLESRNVQRRRRRIRERERALDGAEQHETMPRAVLDGELSHDAGPVEALRDELAYEPFRFEPAALLDRLDEGLAAAIAALGEGERAALLLRSILDLDTGEIAAIQRVPAGTVMSRLFRAREKVRARLAAPEVIEPGRTL